MNSTVAPAGQAVTGLVRSTASGVLGAVAFPSRALNTLRVIAGELRLLSTLTDTVTEMHSELVRLRLDLTSMPGDSRRLADQVERVQETLSGLTLELADLKGRVAPVHGDLARIEAGLAPLPDGIDALLLSVEDLARRLDGMRGEMTGELDALRTDLSSLPFVSKS